MTVHASKGLEFPYVFITGLEQDLFPHGGFGNAGDGEDRAEEERRLFTSLSRGLKKMLLDVRLRADDLRHEASQRAVGIHHRH